MEPTLHVLNYLLLLLAVVGGVLVLVFLVLREFWTWYWKQSRQVELLEAIAKSVQLMEERQRPMPSGAPRPPAPAAP